MRIALGQMNATVGDFSGNGAKIRTLWKEAEAAKADLARYATDHGHTTKDAPPSLWQNYLDGVL